MERGYMSHMNCQIRIAKNDLKTVMYKRKKKKTTTTTTNLFDFFWWCFQIWSTHHTKSFIFFACLIFYYIFDHVYCLFIRGNVTIIINTTVVAVVSSFIWFSQQTIAISSFEYCMCLSFEKCFDFERL